MKKVIAVLTVENDLHALIIRKEMRSDPDIDCRIVETDRISEKTLLGWSIDDQGGPRSWISDSDGQRLYLDEIDLVWWRRVNAPPKVGSEWTDPIILDLIANEANHALVGGMLTTANAIWINDPLLTRRAENKLVQLSAARDVGFSIPATLVSQDPGEVRDFNRRHDGRVIVKPVRGTVHRHLFTRRLRPEHLASDESIRLAPAMYQRCIDGSDHLRVHCFGELVLAVRIESKDLDWRENLDIPFEQVRLIRDEEETYRRLLRKLGLRMGVVDVKMDEAGRPFFLEINPQGQFLFSQGLSGLDLARAFIGFLRNELAARAPERSRPEAPRTRRRQHTTIAAHLAKGSQARRGAARPSR